MADIKLELSKPYTARQVDRHLLDLLFWIKRGYPFTQEQRDQVTRLYQLVEEQK